MAAPTIRDTSQTEDAEGARPSYFLVVLGPEHSETRPLPSQGELSIGRGEEADVRIVDALASRTHAKLYIGDKLELEDLGSSNGTRLRDERIAAHQRCAVAPGEAVGIGTTTLVVQRREPVLRPRRVWPHGYFEGKLIETCAQAEAAKSTFALVWLHLEAAQSGRDADRDVERVEAVLMSRLRPGDLLASYGPAEYEMLLVDTDRSKAEELTAALVGLIEQKGCAARAGTAYFPDDGTSPDALLSSACDRVRGSESKQTAGAAGIVVENPAMRALYALAEKAARGMINVLVLGESGVGKEILAETVHRLSPRSAGPFVCLNCAALSDTLLESELFGYEKGAFTGAVQPKVGLLEAASGGTLFLDEIGEMSLPLQAKVLRALETKQVLRVGATKPRAVDVRFVAAPHRDLEEEIAAKRFREDLFFRLNGIALEIPPLRERLDEIPALAHLFLERASAQLGQSPPRLSAEALAKLRTHTWPGNIRELRNVMERALLLSSGDIITSEHLPLEKMRRSTRATVQTSDVNPEGPAASVAPVAALPAGGSVVATPSPPLSMLEIEKQAIMDALVRCAGNQTRAAELLGMPRRTFCKRMNEYNIPRPRD